MDKETAIAQLDKMADIQHEIVKLKNVCKGLIDVSNTTICISSDYFEKVAEYFDRCNYEPRLDHKVLYGYRGEKVYIARKYD